MSKVFSAYLISQSSLSLNGKQMIQRIFFLFYFYYFKQKFINVAKNMQNFMKKIKDRRRENTHNILAFYAKRVQE